MGRYLWSESATKAHEDSVARQRAHGERAKLEARLAALLQPGDRVTAATLATITAEIGRNTAMMVDEASGPCPVCGLNTYRVNLLCNECAAEPYEDARALDADAAGYGYRAGGADAGDRGVVIATLDEEVW